MKLLFDQNISFKVSRNLQNIFPFAKHLSDLSITTYSDIEIWEYSKVNDFTIITFDMDFIDLANLKGFPPKIIWLRIGNSTTSKIISLFEERATEIKEFILNKEEAFLELRNNQSM